MPLFNKQEHEARLEAIRLLARLWVERFAETRSHPEHATRRKGLNKLDRIMNYLCER